MIILLHGPDTFRSKQKRDELIAAYRSKYAAGLSESFFSDADFTFGAFEEHARGQALFSKKRLIVLTDISQEKSALRELEDYFGKNDLASSKDVFVIVWESRDVQKVKEAAFFLKSASFTQAFPFLQGTAYRTWLRKTSMDCGAQFAPAALELFSTWHEGDSWRSITDMQKLYAYTKGNAIQNVDVEQMCVRPLSLSIFSTLDLLFFQKSEEAFMALEHHIRNGDEPLYLLKMLSYQLRLIALVKEKLDAGEKSISLPGVHPYAARKTIPLARSISWSKLNKLFELLYRSDAAIKQGTADAALCLEMFAFDVACI